MQVYRIDDGVATDGTYHELQFDQGYLAKGYVKGKWFLLPSQAFLYVQRCARSSPQPDSL